MKLLTFFLSTLFLTITSQVMHAQTPTNDTLLHQIINGDFQPKQIKALQSMENGDYFTQLCDSGKAVVKFSYRTGKAVDTLFNIRTVFHCPLKSIEGYQLDSAEDRMLVYVNAKRTYRRIFSANYYVYDVMRKNMKPLSDGGPQESPAFSPDGRMVVFARNNNLYINKLDYDTEVPITTDGEAGEIVNGMPDWMYEEEFDCIRMFVWSPDSKLVAFVKINDTNVKPYSYIRYEGEDPSFPSSATYPTVVSFKYPKAGTAIPQATVQIYNTYYKTTRQVNIGNDSDVYIPKIEWTRNINELAIAKFDRDQTKMQLYFANPRSTVSHLVLTDQSNTYVDYRNLQYLSFTPDGKHFVYVSEKDGYRHAYLYTTTGILEKDLTKGNWDITDFYGYDAAKRISYFQAAEISPLERNVYSMNAKGIEKRLTEGQGTHSATFSNNFAFFIDHTSSLNTPDQYILRSTNEKMERPLEMNEALIAKINALGLPKKEFFTCHGADGTLLNGWMLKPVNFSSSKKYPVLMVQYSGPDSQEAGDFWTFDWEYVLAAKGYIVACVDGRGTAARGVAFRKCTYEHLGVKESDDQVAVAKYLGTLPYVDSHRIGIWGWSYGGYMTLMCMTNGSHVFKAGIAVAPVTDWKYYDAAYTERYMKTPQENPDGYKKSSPLEHAANLHGKLLIIHGLADDNVHPQNTFEFTERLVQANKQFEMQIYTNRNHNLIGGNTRYHLFQRMINFLDRNL
ncbi:S9 family peptidase [Microbacter margulisiae]|uniref:Dipeptidyl-peptidase-4 n=1 Tax=Microbacter margulisiae TaxID=1350067 RepID=A0A7W5H1V5_9PORP|nr:S9 family peptidase [Microbacter margulisiae]MBB3186767.1 dipeptidyl-peptidase-4 [Microbacter margulisiae]